MWMMRQAGPDLPECRAIRVQVGSFMALFRNASLACVITLTRSTLPSPIGQTMRDGTSSG